MKAKSLIYLVIVLIITTIIWTLYISKKISDSKKPEISVNKEAIVTKISALKNIETASMELTKIYEWKEKLADIIPQWNIDDKINSFFFKDDISLVFSSEVKAGFDISNLKSWAIKINPDKTISLTLPQPVILSVIPKNETQTFSRNLGLFTKWNQQLESQVRNEAQENIKTEAIKKWILDQAKANAKWAFEAIFSQMDYSIKEINYDNSSTI